MSEKASELYRKMLTIRLVEDRLQEYCLRGEAGDLHFSKGQEAISVGVCSALRPTDYIVTHHRTIAHEIAKGADLRGLIAEVLGKATGFNKGLAGEMHLSNPEIRHLFSFQIVGTCVPVAVGLAYALKYYQKTDDIVAVFFGDAATSNGQFHEAMNIAKIKKVPILLVCENNGLAGNIRKEMYLPTETMLERMAAYGLQGQSRRDDGNDIVKIAEMAPRLIEAVRKLGEPVFWELETTRLCWHKQGQRDIRSEEELAKLRERDPLHQFELNHRWKDSDHYHAFDQIQQETNKEIEAVFEQVKLDPEANKID